MIKAKYLIHILPIAAVAMLLACASDGGASAATEEGLSKRGQILFLRCRSCHTLEANDDHLVGPNLNGLFGAPAAQKEGFTYSSALSDSGIEWDAKTLDAWLAKPEEFVPGNLMVFVGLPNEDDRAALIAYLQATTQ